MGRVPSTQPLTRSLHSSGDVNAAFRLYLQTGSLKETASALNERGYRTKAYKSRREHVHAGREFLLQDLQRLLKNRAYIAEKVVNKRHGGEVVAPAVWPAIVDKEKFEAVQRLMLNNGYTNHNGAKEIKHVHVLSGGLLVCGRCGADMQGRSGRGRSGKEYFYYVCKETTCGLRAVAPEVEAAVLDRIGALAQHEAVLAKVVTATNRRTAKEVPDLRKQHHALMTQLNDVKASAGKLLDTWQQSDSGRGFVNERLGELGQQREYLEHCIADLNQRIEAATAHQVDTNQVRMALSNIHAIYGELQPYERRELVHLVVHRVELGASKLVLEINGGVCTVMGETPLVAHNGSLVRQTQDWLPEQDSNLQPSG